MVRQPRTTEVAELVRRMSLEPHPEGGWFRETHRSGLTVRTPEHGDRSAFTSILFLLEAPQVSRLHRIDAEELWNWHAGSPLDIQILLENGARDTRRLGPGPNSAYQTVVPAGKWFGAEMVDEGGWCLVGCVVSPGFEFRRFQLADRRKLLPEFPLDAETILRLT
jgi:predicted cupin superfamily sugar epimerase